MALKSDNTDRLQRRLGLAALIFYGVGDILGAGIYALVGEVAGVAGRYSWLAFLVALIVASFTGLTYAELGARFPRSGGESHFCQQAFRSPWASRVIGWLVFGSGVLSLSTISRAFAGYLAMILPDVPVDVMVVSLLLMLAVINFVGIHISSAANIFCTLVETSGLLLVICVGGAFIFRQSGEVPEIAAVVERSDFSVFAILQAASLAFFAFIGFEDMVNVAEEAKDPRRDMPRAIIVAAATAGMLYISVIIIATTVISPVALAESDAPLLLVVQRAAPWVPTWLFTGIALFAVANTGLLNFITASRLLYGMSRDGLLPRFLGQVHEGTKTPHWSVMIVLLIGIALAVGGTLSYLAGTTSILLLSVFVTMNASLIKLKLNDAVPSDSFSVPVAIPVIGAVVCTILLVCTPATEAVSAAIILCLGMILSRHASQRGLLNNQSSGQS